MRYHGGKWKLAKWIIEHFPPHKVYVEPFGGAASVLLQKSPAYAEVYNDCDDDVVTVFRVLRDPILAEQLKNQIQLTPFARTEFKAAYEAADDPVEKARRTIIRSFMGFGSAATNADIATGFRSNSSRSGTTPAHDWESWPKHINTFTQRLRGVVIENRYAIDVMCQHDSSQTLHYVDPPYVHSTRKAVGSYRYEMSDDEHILMASVIKRLSGFVVLSGYKSDLYCQLYSHWQRIDRQCYADGAQKRIECLWLNPRAMKHLQPTLWDGLRL